MIYYPVNGERESIARFHFRDMAERVAAELANGTVVPHPDADGSYAIACTSADRRRVLRRQQEDAS